jgi:phytol kinase
MHSWIQDSVAAVVTLAGASAWLRLNDWLAYRGTLESKLSRKVIHTGTGPLFVACWPLYSAEPAARYFAMLVPLLLTARFFAIGMEWLQDAATVQSTTRTGKPSEVLRGPLYYGIVFIVCTVVFWRNSPIGIVALMSLCGGDGLADILGRRFGKHKLFFNPQKSWVGSAAMCGGSFVFGFVYLVLFNALHYFQPALGVQTMLLNVAAIALLSTLIEALPVAEIDNLTLTIGAIALGWWLF